MEVTTSHYLMYAGTNVIDLSNPSPSDIDIEDIATALSRIARFSGNGETVITVAQHSVHVADDVWPQTPRYRMLALLHDAHEYLTNDIPSPVKRLVRQIIIDTAGVYGIDPIGRISDIIQSAIHSYVGIEDASHEEKDRIKKSDIAVCNGERTFLFPDNCPDVGECAKYPNEVWDADKSRYEFLSLYYHLEEMGVE